MPFYRQMGALPRKRHIKFSKEDGTLYREQVMGTKGFSGIQSILYHQYMPTSVSKAELLGAYTPEYEQQGALNHRHFRTSSHQEESDALEGREYLLGNEDLLIGVVNPTKKMDDSTPKRYIRLARA